MTDEELITYLRNSKGWPTLGNAAADRIELLEYMNNTILGAVEQRDATIEALIAELNTCRRAQVVMDNTVHDLQAKLAKAVEALDYCINAPFSGWTIAQGYAGTILAEIKGK